MKQRFETYEELVEFVNPLLAEQKYIMDIWQPPGETHYILQWQERKTYIAQDGNEYPEEAWITEQGEMIQIQDLEVEHCRNIIRMILRQEREALAAVEKVAEKFSDILSGAEDFGDQEPTVDNDDLSPKRVLH